jgi:hypothetical protein
MYFLLLSCALKSVIMIVKSLTYVVYIQVFIRTSFISEVPGWLNELGSWIT